MTLRERARHLHTQNGFGKVDVDYIEKHLRAVRHEAQVELLEIFEKCPQNVCCCGDSMESHTSPMDAGHSPVSMFDYAVSRYIESED